MYSTSYYLKKPWEIECSKCESIKSQYSCTLSDDFCKDKTPKRWCHYGCGGYLRLYENGREKCTKCGREDYFCNWLYTDSPRNQRIDSYKMRSSLQYLVGLDDNEVSTDFWLNLKASFNYQKKLFPNRFV